MMMNELLALHLVAVGIWIGIIAAEFFIEFDGMKDDLSHIKASKMHFATDIWVEIPAFLIVLFTGALMLNSNHVEGLFLYKVLFGLLAIIFNIVCVYAVFKRRKYALVGDITGMNSTNPTMRLGGAGFIPTFFIAIVLAICSVVQ
ncbi:MAG: hypothetical protein ACR2P1_20220 [Pseudomonadales bacterium]